MLPLTRMHSLTNGCCSNDSKVSVIEEQQSKCFVSVIHQTVSQSWIPTRYIHVHAISDSVNSIKGESTNNAHKDNGKPQLCIVQEQQSAAVGMSVKH